MTRLCIYNIGAYEHIPVYSWLSRKALQNQKETESIFDLKVSSNKISVKWGQIKNFDCPQKNIIEVTIWLVDKDKKIEKKMKDFKNKYFAKI